MKTTRAGLRRWVGRARPRPEAAPARREGEQPIASPSHRAARARRALTSAVCGALAGLVAAGGFPAAGAAAPLPDPAAAEATAGVRPGQLLVGFHPGTDRAARAQVHRGLGATVLKHIEPLSAALVSLPEGLGVEEAGRRYAATGAVRFSQPNYLRAATGVTPNDQHFGLQWGMRNTGQPIAVPGLTPVAGKPDADVDLSEPAGTPDGWDLGTTAPTIVVAVVDGGIQTDHPDLAPNIWTNPGEVPGNGVDDDRNGYVDDVHGWDFSHQGGDPYVSSSDASPRNPSDGCSPSAPAPGASYDDHGTHVAGVLGAVGNNGIGVAGVAWRIKIMPLKFLACDRGDDAAAVEAILYAVRNGAQVINASWGGAGTGLLGGSPPRALAAAIEEAGREGIPVVVAAGNGGSDLQGDDLARHPDYPASFDLPNEIVVAATTSRDRLAGFSNYGGPAALGAPGEMIVSTLAGNAYGFEDGTSMATPFVSGAAALMLSRRPGMSARDIKAALVATVDKVPALASPVTTSGGRLNIAAAVRYSGGSGGAAAGCAGETCFPSSIAPLSTATSYRLVAADGGIFTFGEAPFLGSTGGIPLHRPIVAMAPTPSGQGYWLAASDGGIFAFGDAVFHGSAGGIPLTQPIVGMARTPTGNGYWLAASDGGIFAFGDAVFHGSAGVVALHRPIVTMAATPSGQGYWLVASDGGIFAFGDAVFRGSTGALPLSQPVVGMAATPSGNGYWLVASDGGIFAFGDARFFGSTGAVRLSRPIVAMARTPSGRGYWFVASDGGIFAFGDAPFRGSVGGTSLGQPVVGMAPGS